MPRWRSDIGGEARLVEVEPRTSKMCTVQKQHRVPGPSFSLPILKSQLVEAISATRIGRRLDGGEDN